MAEQVKELTGTQKVAIVLMNLDPVRASTVMKQFSDAEAEQITGEIIRLRRVDADIADQALNEFHELATSGRVGARGGRDFARGLLEASFGSERAAGVLSRVASSMAGKAFEFLDEAEPAQIVTLLDGEMPQTCALVLAHLRPAHASKVIAGFPDDLRTEVARRIATMTSATPESIALVAQSLKERSAAVVAPSGAAEVVGGVQPLVDIINRADVATEHDLLEALDARDPQLAEEVRARMITFADIVRLGVKDVQQVLRGLDAATLATALKGASTELTATVRDNISERNRESLDEERQNLGRVRKKQVDEARAEIARTIRELEAEWTVTLQRGEEEENEDEYVN